ncbi:MAG: transcription termination/antitermination NusG family protein [Pseudomonadota bacterium]|nr:transcription termination/antitermination NusG family protein [Pseudomonadota bacterium]
MNWYLLQTKPNAHTTACKNLRQQGFDVFLPLTTITIKKNGKFLDIKTPLFPGYIFMGTLMDPIKWTTVNATRGISKAVTLDGVYRPVSTYIIEGLQCRCDECGVLKRMDDIVTADRVKIQRGPFANFICTVDQIKDDKRAWVLIDILQQQTRAEVSFDDVSKIN